MVETTAPPIHETSPLSRPKAAFNGHTGSPPSLDFEGGLPSEEKYGARRNQEVDEDAIGQDPSWEPEVYSMGKCCAFSHDPVSPRLPVIPKLTWTGNSPPRVNPFHLLANPDITSPGPPLPAQFQKFATAHQSSSPDDTEVIQQYSATTMSNDDTTPLHITKVTKDTIHVVSAQQMQADQDGGPKRIIQKVGRVFRKKDGEYVETAQVVEGRTVGHEPLHHGAPPSPPVSESGDLNDVNSEEDIPRSSITIEESVEGSEAHSETRRTSIFTSNLTTEPGDLGVSPVRPFAQQVPRRSSWNSATSRTGSLAVVRKAKEKEASERERKESKDLPMLPDATDAHRSDQGGLAPPPRISRRTTNPTPPSPTIPKRSPLVHSQSTFPSVPIPGQQQTTVPGVEGAALDSDILAHSEQIRRERLERRQKKANAENPLEAAAATPAAPNKPERKGTEDPKVLVGNLIGEDHVNYVLMYNMLTGIRIGVSPDLFRRGK